MRTVGGLSPIYIRDNGPLYLMGRPKIALIEDNRVSGS
jgi:hypothetical protein